MVSMIAVASFLSPAEIGSFAAASVLVGLSGVVVESGTTAAIISWTGDLDEAASTGAVSSICFGIALSLLFLLTGGLWGQLLSDDFAGTLATALSGVVLIGSTHIATDALLQRRHSLARRIIMEPVATSMFALVAIVAAWQGMGAWSLVCGTYASATVMAVLSWLLVRWRPHRRHVSLRTWRAISLYARPLLGSELLYRGSFYVTQFSITRFAGAAALGQFQYGSRLAMQAGDAWVNVSAFVLLPTLAKKLRDEESLEEVYRGSIIITLCFGLLSAGVIAVGGSLLVAALLGDKWSTAGHVCQILAPWGLGIGLLSVASEFLKVRGDTKSLLRVVASGFALTVVLVPIAAGVGVLAAALVVSGITLLNGVVAVGITIRRAGIKPRDLLRSQTPIIGAWVLSLAPVLALAAAIPDTSARLPALGEFAAIGLTATLVFFALLAKLAPAVWSDIRKLIPFENRLVRS